VNQGERSPKIVDVSWGRMDVAGLGIGATTVVLSLGMDRQLHVDPGTLRYLEERSVAVHVTETREAVKIYNDLADDTAVAGLFHSTC
jgi:hypothetical protein